MNTNVRLLTLSSCAVFPSSHHGHVLLRRILDDGKELAFRVGRVKHPVLASWIFIAVGKTVFERRCTTTQSGSVFLRCQVCLVHKAPWIVNCTCKKVKSIKSIEVMTIVSIAIDESSMVIYY